MTTTMKQVLHKLDAIHAEIHEMRMHALDPDAIADEEDFQAILDAQEAKRTGKLESLNDLRKRLKI